MKNKIFFISLIALSGAFCTPQQQAQSSDKKIVTDTSGTENVAKADTIILKNLNDSASYAVGISVANFYKQQGIQSLNTAIVAKAIEDLLAGKNALLDNEAATQCMNDYMAKLQAEKIKPRIDSGDLFLAENKLKPNIKTTASGLQYEVIKEGTGIQPTLNDSVTCDYRGTLLNGKIFDESYKRGKPITFSLRGVIKGWQEGLQLMKEGAKYKFYVPYQLGYGAHDYGPIPGGSVLIFDVDLLKVIKKD
ncbi:MAG TPA: FKBP-type peptidyl-prolyl cis-trans isomerase [Chitinophagaceae bacterium]|nr:FKBP-type peptidyl-prolyl cis-trans isomerase [Chitinophagaceae bacterium]